MKDISPWGWALLAILAFNLWALITSGGVLHLILALITGYFVWDYFRSRFL